MEETTKTQEGIESILDAYKKASGQIPSPFKSPIYDGISIEANSHKEVDDGFLELCFRVGFPCRLNGYLRPNALNVLRRRFKCSCCGNISDEELKRLKENPTALGRSVRRGCSFGFSIKYERRSNGKIAGVVCGCNKDHSHGKLDEDTMVKLRGYHHVDVVDNSGETGPIEVGTSFEGDTMDDVVNAFYDLMARHGFPGKLAQTSKGDTQKMLCCRRGQARSRAKKNKRTSKKSIKTGCRFSFLIRYSSTPGGKVKGTVESIVNGHNHGALDESQSQRVRLQKIYDRVDKDLLLDFIRKLRAMDYSTGKIQQGLKLKFNIEIEYSDVRTFELLASKTPWKAVTESFMLVTDISAREIAKLQPIFNGLSFESKDRKGVDDAFIVYCSDENFPCQPLEGKYQAEEPQEKTFQCAVTQTKCTFSFSIRYDVCEGSKLSGSVFTQQNFHNHGPVKRPVPDPEILTMLNYNPQQDIERRPDNPLYIGLSLSAPTSEELDDVFLDFCARAGYPFRLNGFLDINRESRRRRFRCCRAGKRTSIVPEELRQRKRKSNLTGCLFSFTALYAKKDDGSWQGTVTLLRHKHNHEKMEDDTNKIRLAKALQNVDKDAMRDFAAKSYSELGSAKQAQLATNNKFGINMNYQDFTNLLRKNEVIALGYDFGKPYKRRKKSLKNSEKNKSGNNGGMSFDEDDMELPSRELDLQLPVLNLGSEF